MSNTVWIAGIVSTVRVSKVIHDNGYGNVFFSVKQDNDGVLVTFQSDISDDEAIRIQSLFQPPVASS